MDIPIEISDESGPVKTVTMKPRGFKTGKSGYFASDKVTINGVRYQLNFMLIDLSK